MEYYLSMKNRVVADGPFDNPPEAVPLPTLAPAETLVERVSMDNRLEPGVYVVTAGFRWTADSDICPSSVEITIVPAEEKERGK